MTKLRHFFTDVFENTDQLPSCPQRPHHRASSCPAEGPCDSSHEHSQDPNPFKLYGAVVGGPDINGNFVDDRTEYVHTEVATDYNCGWQGILAARVQGVI